MQDSRERLCLKILKQHFNSVNKYPAEEKIEVAKQIIDDGLKEDKVNYSKQFRLEF